MSFPYYANVTWLALITGLLTVDPQDRMTLADAFQHPWALTYALQCLPVTILLISWLQTVPTGLARSRGPSGEAYPISPSYRRSRYCRDRYGAVRSHVRTQRGRSSQTKSCRESPLLRDDDQVMLSATRGSQFTQSLMLFVRPSVFWTYSLSLPLTTP